MYWNIQYYKCVKPPQIKQRRLRLAYKEYFVTVANTSNIILKINEFIMLLKKSYNHHCMQGNNFIALKTNKLKEIIQIYPPFPIQTLCQSNQRLDEGSSSSEENFS